MLEQDIILGLALLPRLRRSPAAACASKVPAARFGGDGGGVGGRPSAATRHRSQTTYAQREGVGHAQHRLPSPKQRGPAAASWQGCPHAGGSAGRHPTPKRGSAQARQRYAAARAR
eukprot:gene10566-19537_t